MLHKDIYISIFNLLDECVRLVKKDKDDPKNSEGEKEVYQKIVNYFELRKLEKLIERNIIHVKDSEDKFYNEDGLNNLEMLVTKKAFKNKLTRPTEITKLCENLIQSLKNVIEIERNNPSLENFRLYDTLETYV